MKAEIRHTLDVLFEPGQVVELRILYVGGRKNTTSGYFDDLDALTAAAVEWDGKGAGIYVVLNEINPVLLARRVNRVEQWATLTTSDHDIVRRRWLPIDFDYQRPAGISASDEEHWAALERARKCAEALEADGWPRAVLGDSGNGGHVLLPIDLPNDNDALAFVQAALDGLHGRFGDERVKVDRTVSNAGRIWKLYGTTACKGDDTPDRPHRRSRLLEAAHA